MAYVVRNISNVDSSSESEALHEKSETKSGNQPWCRRSELGSAHDRFRMWPGEPHRSMRLIIGLRQSRPVIRLQAAAGSSESYKK